jgi:peroxiredoxin
MNTIAPELQVEAWLNAAQPLSLQQLRGKVVAIYAFQMLCPGCVSHGIPQAKAIRDNFAQEDVAVLGLHSVFEHHAVMNRAALEAFVHEYRIEFPVAIDQPSDHGPIPLTMEQYQLRGTPTLLLIDRQGRLRLSHFGRADDMKVGALIGQLVAEAAPAAARCDDDACSIR